MNIKTISLFTLSSFALLSAITYATPHEANNSIIPHSSYFICDQTNKYGVVDIVRSRNATYYTFDGDLIDTVELERGDFGWTESAPKARLDFSAPKPQPVKYVVKHWPGVRVGLFLYKTPPGKKILFYDKNGNIIKSADYTKRTKLKDFSWELDLSLITKIVA